MVRVFSVQLAESVGKSRKLTNQVESHPRAACLGIESAGLGRFMATRFPRVYRVSWS
jgi:hypothetical protein